MPMDPHITLPLTFDVDSGDLTDADGYHYTSPAQALTDVELGMCPCGYTEHIGADMVELLLALEEGVEPLQYTEESAVHSGQEARTEDKYQGLLLATLASVGLISHEGSMQFLGAELTEHGKAWVSSIKSVQFAEHKHIFGEV